jgi:hypothetical protein
MPTAEAHIDTDRPERYLEQICRHAAAMGGGDHLAQMHQGGHPEREGLDVHAEWSDARGAITFAPWGTCVLEAGGSVLTLQIDATDDASLRRIQDILAADLDRFGRRDGLVVTWQDSQS